MDVEEYSELLDRLQDGAFDERRKFSELVDATEELYQGRSFLNIYLDGESGIAIFASLLGHKWETCNFVVICKGSITDIQARASIVHNAVKQGDSGHKATMLVYPVEVMNGPEFGGSSFSVAWSLVRLYSFNQCLGFYRDRPELLNASLMKTIAA